MRAARACLVPLLALALAAQADPPDPRFCGAPARDAHGKIARSTAEKARFARLYPCPSTGEVTGACPGWAIDHVVPLACGGCDAVGNMQWLDVRIKSASGAAAKDRWERRVYETSIACR